jgi:hypothetical protein
MSVNLPPLGASPKVALRAVAAVAEKWRISRTKRYLLLGVLESSANHWFSQLELDALVDESLPPGVLERISHLLSIYDRLHRLLKGDAADQWIHDANRAFGGRKPVDLLLSGRMDELMDVRRYVDRVVEL